MSTSPLPSRPPLHGHSHSAGRSIGPGRRLYNIPTLWQDWDREAFEGTVGYWELFTDLILVAAATSIADNLQTDLSWNGLYEFALLYFITVNGWLLYTLQYTTRFQDSSLLHSGILFCFLLGMGGSVVNASYGTSKAFSTAAILQRLAVIVMFVSVAAFVPRARLFSTAIIVVTVIDIACLSIPIFVVVDSEFSVAPYAWTAAVAVELFAEVIQGYVLPGRKLVPINIEHSKDRLGVLVLVMLGETVISSTITYRELMEEQCAEEEAEYQHEKGGEVHHDTTTKQYYTVLSLSFLLIFMQTLLYFNVQPEPKDHAFRRSRFAGTACYVMHKFLGLFLLAVGVSIKLFVKIVVADGGSNDDGGTSGIGNDSANEERTATETREPTAFAVRLLGYGVSCSLFLLFGMRCCHYGGKIPRMTEPPHVIRMMLIWWGMMIVAIPIFFVAVEVIVRTPNPIVTGLGFYSIGLLILCAVESYFTHVLEEYLPNEETAPLHPSSHGGEDDNIQTKATPSYGSTGT